MNTILPSSRGNDGPPRLLHQRFAERWVLSTPACVGDGPPREVGPVQSDMVNCRCQRSQELSYGMCSLSRPRSRAGGAGRLRAGRRPPAGARARSRTARDCALTPATFVRRRSRRKRRDDDNDRETPCRDGGRRVRGAQRHPRAGRRGRRRHRGGPDQPPPVPAAAVPGGGGILPPGLIAPALRGIIKRERNARALLAEVQDLDLDARVVQARGPDGRDIELPYDTLVVAAGATHSYFGKDQFAEFAPGMKTVEDARYLRDGILSKFEMAEMTTDPVERAEWLTFVVIGAGPTGIELVGQIAELAHTVLPKDYRSVDTREARIILLEGAGAV